MGARVEARIGLTAIALLVSPSAASAEEPRAPDSPAGVEYDLPLNRARERAAPGSDMRPSARARREAQLFGAGVAASAAPGPRAGTPESASGDGEPRDPQRADAGRLDRAVLGASTESDSGPALVIAAALTLLGLALGWLLRRTLFRRGT